ncbi:MAG: hypothetical protein ACRBFS_15090 [Aureispira sp.]
MNNISFKKKFRMVRESFLKKINERIDNDYNFTSVDFNVEQRSTQVRGVKTTIKIDYNYHKDFYLSINIPENRSSRKKNNYSEEEELYYKIRCEYCPGKIELNETVIVDGTRGVLDHIDQWLDMVWEELLAIPVNRQLNELKSSVNELFSKVKEISDDNFTVEERKTYEERLSKLEEKFTANLEAQKLDKEELNEKLNDLHKEINSLKTKLSLFNKKNWFKSFGAKVLSWGAKPENQKMISNGAKIVQGFIGEGESNQ